MNRETAVEQLAWVVHEMLKNAAVLEETIEETREHGVSSTEWWFCSQRAQRQFNASAQELRKLRSAGTPDFTPWRAAIDDVLEHAEALQAALRCRFVSFEVMLPVCCIICNELRPAQ